MVSYAVRAARTDVASRERAQLCDLWRQSLPLELAAESKLAWLADHAPVAPLAAYFLLADGTPVGTAAVGHRTIWTTDGSLRAGLLQDLGVLPAHRSVLPALTLVRRVREQTLATVEVAMGFPNHQAEGVFRRAGYRVLGETTRYVRVLRHRDYLERPEARARVPAWAGAAWGVPAVRRAAALALDASQLVHTGRPFCGALTQSAKPDARMDQIWSAHKAEYGAVSERTLPVVRWRWALLPTTFAVWSSHDVPYAWSALRRVGSTLHIVDLFGAPSRIPEFLGALARAAYRDGAEAISMRILGSPWLATMLVANQFVARPGRRTVVVDTNPTLATEHRNALHDAAFWHITDHDEDM